MYKESAVCFVKCCCLVCYVLQYKDRLEREKFLQDLQKRIINCPVNPDTFLFLFI